MCIAFGLRSYTPCAQLIGWRARAPAQETGAMARRKLLPRKLLNSRKPGRPIPSVFCSAALRSLSDQWSQPNRTDEAQPNRNRETTGTRAEKIRAPDGRRNGREATGTEPGHERGCGPRRAERLRAPRSEHTKDDPATHNGDRPRAASARNAAAAARRRRRRLLPLRPDCSKAGYRICSCARCTLERAPSPPECSGN
jgi:hypothetical protein